jgi:1-acyl-sn-glycerol-3-phosphate acyltransferase
MDMPGVSRPARITVFDTPLIGALLRWISRFVLRLRGWTTEVRLPKGGRMVAVFAPHTSYWDLPVMMMVAAANRVSPHWMGTDALFRRPYGWLFRWLGGIPVDRSQRSGITAAGIAAFAERRRLVLGIAPEGTRYPVERWRTGFYHMAVGAGVPILLAFLDAETRTAGAFESFLPSGDLIADGERIRRFYEGRVGIRRERTRLPGFGPG